MGFGAVLHEIRSDEAQLLCAAFLLVAGAGPWALDTALARWRTAAREPRLRHEFPPERAVRA
jgi:hypothetical protein